MTMGEIAKRAGLRPSAIRYYERVGLLPKAARSGGQRRYDGSILGRLAVLERAKNCGFTLDEVRQFFNDEGRPSERWQRYSSTKQDPITEVYTGRTGPENGSPEKTTGSARFSP